MTKPKWVCVTGSATAVMLIYVVLVVSGIWLLGGLEGWFRQWLARLHLISPVWELVCIALASLGGWSSWPLLRDGYRACFSRCYCPERAHRS